MQLDKTGRYKSSAECARAIIRNQGFKGLFQGATSTAFREVFAYAAQFATYEYLKNQIVTKDNPNLTFMQGIVVGTFAGINCWIFSYPQDIIKTKIQVSEPGTYPPLRLLNDGGFIACGR